MIDKYKKPRVQRLVPYRSAAASGPPPDAVNWARDMARSIVGIQRATAEARLLGAMPTEFSPTELRAL